MSGLLYAVAIITIMLSTFARAEALLIKGMGRVVGWPVATAGDTVRFRDCAGVLHDMADARLARTDKRCSQRQPVASSGVVIAIDRSRSLLVVETEDGRRQPFLVARSAAGVLAELTVGDRVRVEGPVPGRADHVAAK